jgi:two-component system OmpR family response regulator
MLAGQRILIVDDDVLIGMTTRICLEDAGFETTYCSSGRQALAMVGAAAPDILLLDVMMPHMDGPALLRELRRLPATARTPVIFYTGGSAYDAERLLALGALAVIPKPFDPARLGLHIRHLTEGSSPALPLLNRVPAGSAEIRA